MARSDSNSEVIAIIGGGLIGESWAALFTAYGADVALFEPSEAARKNLIERVEHARLQVQTLMNGVSEPGQLYLPQSIAEAVEKSAWIQECVPENVTLKREVYAKIIASAPAETIIASSTSSLIWSELSEGMAEPARLITAHPFNPPHLMPLVEIFSAHTIRFDAADRFYRRFERQPVRVKREARGHIANRLASALWREAVNMVAEGIAEVKDIDAALVYGPGLRWSVVGAHMAYHLGGGPGGIEHYLAHLGPSQVKRWEDLGHPALDEETKRKLIGGIWIEADGRSVCDLEKIRDEGLIAVQKALNQKRV